MKSHINFYENIKEANMRINNTLVLYDGEPHYVLAVSDKAEDGIFRVYLDPLSPDGNHLAHQMYDVPCSSSDTKTVGERMDAWLETPDGRKSGVIRKMMNSPKFAKFRPFPLGMMNSGGLAMYVERKPCRYTQQGLMDNMVNVAPIVFEKEGQRISFNLYGSEMYNTIKGIYPDARECLEMFKEDKIANKSVAFSRNFAFVQGPLNLLYIAYKADIVGFIPATDATEVRLGREFQHLKELVQEIGLFDKVS